MNFKSILQAWKEYQKDKFKIANMYPCIVTFSYDRSVLQGRLSFVGVQDERRLEFQTLATVNTEFLWSIRGTIPEHSTIRLTLSEERVIILHNRNKERRQPGFQVFETFER